MKNEFVFNKSRILGYFPIKQIITSALISGILLIGLYTAESLYPKNSIFAIVSMDNSLSEQLKFISFLSRQGAENRITEFSLQDTSCENIYSNETDPINIKLIPFSSNGIITVESRHKDLAFNKLRDFYDCSVYLLKKNTTLYEDNLIEYFDSSPAFKGSIFKQNNITDIKISFDEIERLKTRKAFINQHLVINSEIKNKKLHYYGLIYLSIFGIMIFILLLFGKRFNKL